jgi:hypothetical protein
MHTMFEELDVDHSGGLNVQEVELGLGRIVASEIEAPIISANLV